MKDLVSFIASSLTRVLTTDNEMCSTALICWESSRNRHSSRSHYLNTQIFKIIKDSFMLNDQIPFSTAKTVLEQNKKPRTELLQKNPRLSVVTWGGYKFMPQYPHDRAPS